MSSSFVFVFVECSVPEPPQNLFRIKISFSNVQHLHPIISSSLIMQQSTLKNKSNFLHHIFPTSSPADIATSTDLLLETTIALKMSFLDPTLPPDWAAAKAADGRIYYYHKQTQKTSWTHPAKAAAPKTVGAAMGASIPALAAALAGSAAVVGVPDPANPGIVHYGDWQEIGTPDGRRYYNNKVTGVTTWERPGHLPPLAGRGCCWGGRGRGSRTGDACRERSGNGDWARDFRFESSILFS